MADIATLSLRVDGTGATITLQNFTREAGKAAEGGSAVERMVGRLRGEFLKLVGIAGVLDFFKTLVVKTSEAQDSIAQLAAGVQSTGYAARLTVPELTALSEHLQRVTDFSHTVIEGAEGILLTFTNIRGDIFKEATADVLDLSKRMGGDAKGAALQLGKALQDPVTGLLALRRAGVSFTQQQRDVIKNLTETGQVAKAQKMILAELEKEFGGSAAAARNTLGGALRGLKNDFFDLFEVSNDDSTGVVSFIKRIDEALIYTKETILPLVGAGILKVTDVVTSAIRVWNSWGPDIRAVVVAVAAMSFGLPRLAMLVGTLTSVVKKAATAFAEMAEAETLADLLSPQGWLVLGLAAVAGGFAYVGYQALQASIKAREAANEFRAALTEMDDATLNATASTITRQWASVDKTIADHRNTLNALKALEHETTDPTTEHTDSVLRSHESSMQRKAAEYLRNLLGIQDTTTKAQLDSLIDQETATIDKLQHQSDTLLERGTSVANELRQRQEHARTLAAHPEQPFSTSTHESTDAEKNRLAENAKMIAAAQAALQLAGMEGMAQERLRIILDANTKALEAEAKFTGDLLNRTRTAIDRERDLKLEALDVQALHDQTNAREDMIRTMDQSVTLAGMEGAAQQKLRIEYDATNKVIAARRSLTGAALDEALGTIEIERQRKLAEAVVTTVQGVNSQIKDIFSNTFESLFEGGITKFSQLFDGVKRLFLKMIADMLAQNVMKKIGSGIAAALAGTFGDLKVLQAQGGNSLSAGTAQLSSSAGALNGSATNLGAAATRLITAAGALMRAAGLSTPEAASSVTPFMGKAGTDAPQPIAVQSVSHGALTSITNALGPLLVGFSVGGVVGGMTTNRVAGTVGGAVAGAGTGALIGSMAGPAGTVIGAIVGGLAGAIGGFLGSRAKERQQQAALAATIEQNNMRLTTLHEDLAGGLMRGFNIGKALDALARYHGTNKNDFENATKRAGLSLEELELIAQQVGITLYDSAGKLIPGALSQLQQALELTAKTITSFTASLEDQQQKIDAYNKLFDVPTTPQNTLNDKQKLLNQMDPELMKQLGLSNLDLSTEAGRKAFLAGLQEIYKMIDSGQLTPALLGSFSDKGQLIDAILSAKDALDAFKTTVDNVTTDFPKAMDVTLFEQLYGRGAQDQNEAVRITPTGPTDTGGTTTTYQTGVQVNGDLIVHLTPAAGVSDEDLARQLERAIGRRAALGRTTYLPNTETRKA